MTEPNLAADGAEHYPNAVDEAGLTRIEHALVNFDGDRPGTRLHEGMAGLRDLLLPDGDVGRIAAATLGPRTRPVRLIFFDKRDNLNWSLGLHQDRTIAVKRRIDVEGFAPWSVKSGQVHVQPPQDLIDRMLTLRLHLDDVDAGNAPLVILPGSHQLGRLTNTEIAVLAGDAASYACLARRGDVWAYGTAIIHASDPVVTGGRRRRVLQIDYSASSLPGGLEWALDLSRPRCRDASDP